MKRIILLPVLILLLTACSMTNEPVPGTSSAAVTNKPEAMPITAKDPSKNWSGLTTEQYLEDFDRLYRTLSENFPFFGVAKRVYGIDFEERYKKTRQLLQSCVNDTDFIEIVTSEFMPDMSKGEIVGHLSLLSNSAEYDYFLKAYMSIESKSVYAEVLTGPVTASCYKNMAELSGYSDKLDPGAADSVSQNNASFSIIKEGEIAYIRIPSFSHTFCEKDKPKLLSFYEITSDYKHLIIDITGNGGGCSDYFMDLIMAPNIDSRLTVPVYFFVKYGENNNKFLNIDEKIEQRLYKPVKDLPDLPKMNAEDLSMLDYYTTPADTVSPLYKEKAFKGRIWLLVDESNYSAAEYAAMFMKTTDFATLVGRNTSGDGIGTDPVFFALPNSGLIVRYSAVYGTDKDGANSEEFGTAPDILSPLGETPLETCLRAISQEGAG